MSETAVSSIQVATAGTARASGLSRIGLVVLLAGAFLSMADFFIVNVALPSLVNSLHASTAVVELVVAGYATAYALLLVLGGRLGDAFGRRRMFVLGIASFTAMSMAAGVAPSPLVLVVARILQGAAAAMMVPQVLASIQAASQGPARTRALGAYVATGGLAAVAGQVVGGLLVSADIAGTGWRPIFLVNVPIGVLGIIGARWVPETKAANPAAPDPAGTALLAWTVVALLVPLTEGRALGWPVWSWLLLISAAPAFVAFVAVERRLERAGGVPLVPPSLVRNPTMRLGLAMALVFFAGFGGFMFCYALALQVGMGLSPVQAGLGLVPMGVAFWVGAVGSGRLTARFDRRRVVIAGALLQAGGLAVTAVLVWAGWPGVPLLALAPGLVVIGVGQALVMSPLFALVLAGVPVGLAGVGSGVLVTTQQTAIALGVATLGNVFLTLGTSPSAMGDAFAVVLVVQVAAALVVARLARSVKGSAATG